MVCKNEETFKQLLSKLLSKKGNHEHVEDQRGKWGCLNGQRVHTHTLHVALHPQDFIIKQYELQQSEM